MVKVSEILNYVVLGGVAYIVVTNFDNFKKIGSGLSTGISNVLDTAGELGDKLSNMKTNKNESFDSVQDDGVIIVDEETFKETAGNMGMSKDKLKEMQDAQKNIVEGSGNALIIGSDGIVRREQRDIPQEIRDKLQELNPSITFDGQTAEQSLRLRRAEAEEQETILRNQFQQAQTQARLQGKPISGKSSDTTPEVKRLYLLLEQARDKVDKLKELHRKSKGF